MTQLVLDAQTPTSKDNAVTIMPDESLVFRQEHHNRKYNPQVKLCCTVVYIYFCIFALRQIMGDAALVHTHNLFFLSKIRKISIFFTHVFPDAKKKKWPHLFFGEKKKKKKNLPASSVFSKKCLRNNCIFFFGLKEAFNFGPHLSFL